MPNTTLTRADEPVKESALWTAGVVPYDVSKLKRQSMMHRNCRLYLILSVLLLSGYTLYKSVKNDIKALNKILVKCIYFRYAQTDVSKCSISIDA